jgi:mannose-1-phosphate guanylyltransferase
LLKLLGEKSTVTEPWGVILAGRADPGRNVARQSAPNRRDPLAATVRRAATVTSLARIAAVISAPAVPWRQSPVKELATRNLYVQPRHLGTAYEVLLALLFLESRVCAATPVFFLPADHIVDDEEVMTNALTTMIEWIAEDPGPVYLLGALPQGPHDQLGYIIPWHDAILMPTGVYEFVERPDIHRARRLINAGGLWNTFIFGGCIASLLRLFPPRFDATIADFRAALQSQHIALDLTRLYDRLTPADFSQELLARQTDQLRVLRLLRCGWWPLKAPTLNPPLQSA